MLKMTVKSVCSESDKFLVNLAPINSTSSEVYTSAEVHHGSLDTRER
jgi:hypothetical protein